MIKLTLAFCLVLALSGCKQQQQPRSYTEVVSQTPQAPQEQMADAATPSVPKNADNPHAGFDMGGNVTPDAKANLQKMLAEGQDPHAGIDMSSFTGKDPHAGLNLPGMMGDASGVPSPWTWTLPKGWKQGPAKAMRLASFYIDQDPDAIDCSIVSLPGEAGGIEPNLKRWMGQIGLLASDENYKRLLSESRTVAIQGSLQAKVYDLAAVQQGPAAKSMFAAIISTPGATVFVKMTGSKEAVEANKSTFLEFLKSLALKS